MRLFHRFGRRLYTAIVMLSLLTLSGGVSPVHALASIGFITYAYGVEGGPTCGEGAILFGARLTGSVTDPAPSSSYHGHPLAPGDYFAVAAFDGNGNHLWDSGTQTAPVGNTISFTETIPLRGITARPITVVLMDLSQAMDSPLLRGAGPTWGSFSIDPAQFAGNCLSLPEASILPSYYNLLSLADTTCTPGEAPTFNFEENVAASAHVFYQGMLTNLRTYARSGPFYTSTFNGPYGPFAGTGPFGAVVIPAGTGPHDNLLMGVSTIDANTHEDIHDSTLPINCTEARRRGDLLNDNILNPVGSGYSASNNQGCFV
ncbi:MAG TPA: hypothetical protein VKQ72_08060, partial [Aggregatilineales bacterium]|nr:hypothetical protein [Aggregatilineales bacterium]